LVLALATSKRTLYIVFLTGKSYTAAVSVAVIFKSLTGTGLVSVFHHTLFIPIQLAVFHCLYLPLLIWRHTYGSCNILQQVQEGSRVCERTVVHGTCNYFIIKILVTESLVVLLD